MRRLGDRKDAVKIRNIDSMHYFMPVLFKDRSANEAFMAMDVELEAAEDFISKYNEGKTEEDRLSLFGLIIAAMLKTVCNRPQLNRFIKNKDIYQRTEVSAAFVVKKEFTDEGSENLARVDADDNDTVFSIQKKLNAQITKCKTETDETTDAMNILQKFPIKGFIGALFRWLDKHGLIPQSIVATDPYQCSVVLTNLGSIGLSVGYHHLMNWGTNSIFVVVGKKEYKPFFDKNGNAKMKKVIKLSFTVDERISDGYYFAKSFRLLKRYLENPDLLAKSFNEQ